MKIQKRFWTENVSGFTVSNNNSSTNRWATVADQVSHARRIFSVAGYVPTLDWLSNDPNESKYNSCNHPNCTSSFTLRSTTTINKERKTITPGDKQLPINSHSLTCSWTATRVPSNDTWQRTRVAGSTHCCSGQPQRVWPSSQTCLASRANGCFLSIKTANRTRQCTNTQTSERIEAKFCT